ncbi:MAG: DegT/DnrJ/EryC1/StrS family aminotransferase [Bacteroidales bacterium]|nr:DegT/DnrJ/EryC1/StrS family aminotransferase [Candidatus Cacconaster merdequi]
MKRDRIYLCLAHMSEKSLEQMYVKEAFDTNWVVPLGPNVNAFEKSLEEFVGSGKEVVALASGTSAVHLALLACGVGPEDEVCVQSFTFCASANPVRYIGARPVFVDSEEATWNMDPELLEKAIIDRIEKTGRKPKAIIVVALYGMPYDIERIMAVSEKYGIPLIEDAAEGFGSTFKGRVLGTFGQFGVLSFNGNKMITTSGGGALICPDKQTKDYVMWLATQAREAFPYYQHEAIGYNYRMSNICAGIGRGQMTVVKEHISHHRHTAEMYGAIFDGSFGITLHKGEGAFSGSNYWLNTILIDPSVKVKGQESAYSQRVTAAVGGAPGVMHQSGYSRSAYEPNANVEALRVALDKAGVEARPLWKPMHLQPVYEGFPAYLNPVRMFGNDEPSVSGAIFKVGLCLPSGPLVSDDDIKYIADTIKSSIEKQ